MCGEFVCILSLPPTFRGAAASESVCCATTTTTLWWRYMMMMTNRCFESHGILCRHALQYTTKMLSQQQPRQSHHNTPKFYKYTTRYLFGFCYYYTHIYGVWCRIACIVHINHFFFFFRIYTNEQIHHIESHTHIKMSFIRECC